ncbi:18100_t:CDS:2 [Funneliformis geosporum]|nr:18100_t:CDS:2 [Funneliformis geosporum]
MNKYFSTLLVIAISLSGIYTIISKRLLYFIAFCVVNSIQSITLIESSFMLIKYPNHLDLAIILRVNEEHLLKSIQDDDYIKRILFPNIIATLILQSVICSIIPKLKQITFDILDMERLSDKILLWFSLILLLLLLINTLYCHQNLDKIQKLHLALNPNLGEEYEYLNDLESDDDEGEHDETDEKVSEKLRHYRKTIKNALYDTVKLL